MKPSVINLDIRPGDLNNSFSVDAVDQDFIARNRDLTVSSVSNQSHLLGLLKADLNSDGQIDQSDLDEFQKLNPDASKINSDFLGEPLTQNPGDISKVMVRGSHWGRGFQGALGTDVGFTLAPASCLRSLPWIRMNQLLIASPSSAPISGTVTLSATSNGKDNILLSSSLEKLPRLSGFSVLSLPSPHKPGIYQLKISVNNATKALDGILTRVIKFRVLEGDIDGNYLVDRMDLEILRKYFNQRVNSTNIRADLDANGFINIMDLKIAMSRQGLALKDPSIPPPQITEINKVQITDENGFFLTGSISATIDSQSVAKAELNGQDAALVTVAGALGSKVLWSNSLTGETFETILDGKGDYDGRGHYVAFKVQSIPDVPNLPPELPPVTEINKVYITDGNGKFLPGVLTASINGKTVGKSELTGKDAGLVTVTGAIGSTVIWSNSLNKDIFETILDGKGDYGERGHYVIFKVAGSPSVPPLPSSSALAFGWGQYKETFGSPSTVFTYEPTLLTEETGWTVISYRSSHILAIKDGKLFAMGQNGSGQLGDGTTTNSATPVQIGNETGWTAVAAGERFSLAIKDGKLYGWGENQVGQLGMRGVSGLILKPTQIGTFSDWTKVRAGVVCAMGIRAGALYGWGWNVGGQLGTGSKNEIVAEPTQIGTESTWQDISVGNWLSAGISAGRLFVWGSNSLGQIGDGTTEDRPIPTQIGNFKDWSSVSVDTHHAVGIRAGLLYAWGNNQAGQVGDGTTQNRSVPTQISAESGWVMASAGGYHSLAIKDGTLFGWGSNSAGELGDGTTTRKTSPTQLGTESTWTIALAAFQRSFGVRTAVFKSLAPQPAPEPAPQPEPSPKSIPAAKVGVGFETGSDMDFNDVYACMPNGQFNVNGREIISTRDQTVPIYFGNIASEHNWIIVKAFMSGQLIVERHVALVPRQQSAGKTVLELPKGSTVTFQLRNGIVQADPKRTVIDINTCRSGS